MEFNSINNNFNYQPITNQKAGLVKVSDEQNNKSQSFTQNQPNNIQNSENKINPTLVYDLKMAKMDNETLVKYLQSLLNMPNSLDKFIKELNSKNNSKLVKILIENQIDLKALGNLFNDNSKIAITKLLQTVSNSLKSGLDTKQLEQVLSILTSIQSNSSINSVALKELLLLYVPVNFAIFNKDISFNNVESSKNQNSGNYQLTILLETINFSNILCKINENNNELFIELNIDFDFPKNEFLRILKAFENEANLNLICDFNESEKNIVNNNIQNFKINSNNSVSLNILILSHFILQTIFQLDNNFIKEK